MPDKFIPSERSIILDKLVELEYQRAQRLSGQPYHVLTEEINWLKEKLKELENK